MAPEKVKQWQPIAVFYNVISKRVLAKAKDELNLSRFENDRIKCTVCCQTWPKSKFRNHFKTHTSDTIPAKNKQTDSSTGTDNNNSSNSNGTKSTSKSKTTRRRNKQNGDLKTSHEELEMELDQVDSKSSRQRKNKSKSATNSNKNNGNQKQNENKTKNKSNKNGDEDDNKNGVVDDSYFKYTALQTSNQNGNGWKSGHAIPKYEDDDDDESGFISDQSMGFLNEDVVDSSSSDEEPTCGNKRKLRRKKSKTKSKQKDKFGSNDDDGERPLKRRKVAREYGKGARDSVEMSGTVSDANAGAGSGHSALNLKVAKNSNNKRNGWNASARQKIQPLKRTQQQMLRNGSENASNSSSSGSNSNSSNNNNDNKVLHDVRKSLELPYIVSDQDEDMSTPNLTDLMNIIASSDDIDMGTSGNNNSNESDEKAIPEDEDEDNSDADDKVCRMQIDSLDDQHWNHMHPNGMVLDRSSHDNRDDFDDEMEDDEMEDDEMEDDDVLNNPNHNSHSSSLCSKFGKVRVKSNSKSKSKANKQEFEAKLAELKDLLQNNVKFVTEQKALWRQHRYKLTNEHTGAFPSDHVLSGATIPDPLDPNGNPTHSYYEESHLKQEQKSEVSDAAVQFAKIGHLHIFRNNFRTGSCCLLNLLKWLFANHPDHYNFFCQIYNMIAAGKNRDEPLLTREYGVFEQLDETFIPAECLEDSTYDIDLDDIYITQGGHRGGQGSVRGCFFRSLKMLAVVKIWHLDELVAENANVCLLKRMFKELLWTQNNSLFEYKSRATGALTGPQHYPCCFGSVWCAKTNCIYMFEQALTPLPRFVSNFGLSFDFRDVDHIDDKVNEDDLELQYQVVKWLMWQLMKVLKSRHKRKLIHRDLKAANIAVISNGALNYSKLLDSKNKNKNKFALVKMIAKTLGIFLIDEGFTVDEEEHSNLTRVRSGRMYSPSEHQKNQPYTQKTDLYGMAKSWIHVLNIFEFLYFMNWMKQRNLDRNKQLSLRQDNEYQRAVPYFTHKLAGIYLGRFVGIASTVLPLKRNTASERDEEGAESSLLSLCKAGDNNKEIHRMLYQCNLDDFNIEACLKKFVNEKEVKYICKHFETLGENEWSYDEIGEE